MPHNAEMLKSWIKSFYKTILVKEDHLTSLIWSWIFLKKIFIPLEVWKCQWLHAQVLFVCLFVFCLWSITCKVIEEIKWKVKVQNAPMSLLMVCFCIHTKLYYKLNLFQKKIYLADVQMLYPVWNTNLHIRQLTLAKYRQALIIQVHRQPAKPAVPQTDT